jgi:hypothetical protein
MIAARCTDDAEKCDCPLCEADQDDEALVIDPDELSLKDNPHGKRDNWINRTVLLEMWDGDGQLYVIRLDGLHIRDLLEDLIGLGFVRG